MRKMEMGKQHSGKDKIDNGNMRFTVKTWQ